MMLLQQEQLDIQRQEIAARTWPKLVPNHTQHEPGIIGPIKCQMRIPNETGIYQLGRYQFEKQQGRMDAKRSIKAGLDLITKGQGEERSILTYIISNHGQKSRVTVRFGIEQHGDTMR